ncbi:hypothetical protein [Nocardioides psychrotolerans]|uniref:hypothetical protein n=1 Tax=Nocardioides psychrotolerans TaxID=1005945 RepID=UPI00313812F8
MKQVLTRASFIICLSVISLSGGALATILEPIVALGAFLATFMLVAVLISAKARILATAGGALLVFQAPGDEAKIAYLGLLIVCLMVAARNLARSDDRVSLQAFRPMLTATVAVLALLAFSYLNATTNQIAPIDWFRDALGYFLILALPLVGLEASQHLSRRWLMTTLTVLGLVAAVGLALDWLGRRGAASTERVVLATATFTLLALAFVAVKAGLGPKRIRWMVALVVIVGSLVATGSRTNALLLVMVLVGIVGAQRRARVPLPRIILLGGVFALVAVYFSTFLSDSGLVEANFFTNRLRALTDAAGGGLSQDQSFLAREYSYRLAQKRWEASPWLGGAPGYIYRPSGLYTLDTPWMVPAKFGVVGTALLLGYLLTVARCVRRLATRTVAPEFTAARGWMLAMIALTPFGPWIEDKGTGIALMMIVAIAVAVTRDDGAMRSGSPSPSASPELNTSSPDSRPRSVRSST